MGNPFRWVELNTDDLDGAKEFYSEIFNWKVEAFEDSSIPYYFVKTGGDAEGGMMGKTSSRTPTAWTPFMEVKDLSSVCDKVERLGGRILKHKTSIPGMGWFAVLHDPQGAVFGLWQPRRD